MPLPCVVGLRQVYEAIHQKVENEMIRFCCVIGLLCVIGCTESSPEPQAVIEESRQTIADAEKKLEAIQKSTDETKARIDAMKQNSPDPAAK